MAGPNASYSVRFRVEVANRPGVLGRLTTAIGEAGGNIIGVDLVDASADQMVRDLTVFAIDVPHVEQIRKAVEALDDVHVVDVRDRTFLMHEGGKIEVRSKSPLTTRDDLSMAYTPGVARVCLAIADNPADVHKFTIKRNSVAVVTDGTAVLGLGDIGPAAALPVMEGKAMLFKEFAGVDAFPICLDVQNSDELVEAVERLAPVFGGINLEDIAAPRCFEIEMRLRELLDIPVFHDDQHGTAIITAAGLINAIELTGRRLADTRVVINGAGAAGVACTELIKAMGVPHGNVMLCDTKGVIYQGRESGMNQWKSAHAIETDARTLAD
ncbi:MAG: ACT domain-containing protein, partial [Actinobacteria bacterium]|nr:ACT domain-containing protein [Actinomycetota bacterium]